MNAQSTETSKSALRRLGALAGLLNAGILAIAIGIFLWRSLPNDAIWGDESDGVFRSLGYPADDGMRGLTETLAGTRSTNDAGGFDLLLRLWMQLFGSSIVALRILPAIFFCVYLIALIFICRRFRLPWWLALTVPGVMLLENITPYYAVEIRPYAGELAATTALLALGLWLIAKPTWFRACCYVIAVATLASQHYSAIGPTVAVLVVMVIHVWQRRASWGWQSKAMVLGPGLLGFLMLPVLYLALRGSPFGSERQHVGYLDQAMLRYADAEQWLSLLRLNFITPTTIPRTLFLVLLPVAWWWHRRRSMGTPRELCDAWLYVLTGTAVAFLLSLGGFLPWYLGTRWSINDVGYIAISLAGLVGLALPWLRRLPNWLTASIIVGSVMVTAVGGARLATYERPGYPGYLHGIGREMLAGGPGSLTLDAWLYWDVRYLIDRSGDYNELQSEWDAVRDSVLTNGAPAESTDVEAFLRSSRTRMLLRNSNPLEGIVLPVGMKIVRVDGQRGPILLVKP